MALLSHCTSADRRFEQFTSRVFREEMTASTLNMHYTIADPAAFGITDYEPVLPLYILRAVGREWGTLFCAP